MSYKQLKYSNISKLIDLNSPVFASRLSLIVCIFLSMAGIFLGTIENSLAVQINGLIAAIDIVNALFFISAVNHSMRMPDLFYNYGYGKYESLSILVGAVLLIGISTVAVYESVLGFQDSESETNHIVLIVFSSLSFFVMRWMSGLQSRAAKKHTMPVLEYDSEVWRFDSYIEIGVLANLIIGMVITGYGYTRIVSAVDSLTAIVLIALAMKIPIKYGKSALNDLLDRTLPESFQYDILAIIVENISNMCEYRGVHTRKAGKDIFIDIDVIMPYDYTLEEAFRTEKIIQDALSKKYPTAVTRLYVIPCNRDCYHDGKHFCPVRKTLINLPGKK